VPTVEEAEVFAVKIAEMFSRDIGRPISGVIRVDDALAVANEIDEYVVTDHILNQLEAVFDVYETSIQHPAESTNVWVSGPFGSGKSSFAKMVGYLAENPSIRGRSVLERFVERVKAPKMEALLNAAHRQAPALSVFVDMTISHNLVREDKSIVVVLYRALLERLDYSRNLLLAQLEFELEEDGQLRAFEETFQQVSKGHRTWKERRDLGLAKSEASHALHLLWPGNYRTADAWAKQFEGVDVTADWFAERALNLLARRGGGRKRLVFIVDEVGQYIARSTTRLLDLKATAEALGRHGGNFWLIVTAQSIRVDDGELGELPNVQDRFPIQVDLLTSDVEEVISRRLLSKSPGGRDELRTQLASNHGKLLTNIKLHSGSLGMTYSQGDILRSYPLLPYQVPLLLDVVATRRARALSPIGFHRTMIQVVQQLVISPRVGLGQHRVGELVTLDRAYDLLEPLIPAAWRSHIDQVKGAYGNEADESRVTKVIALCSDVGDLPLEAQNIAALLHPAIDAGSVLPNVHEALEHLVVSGHIQLFDNSYQLA
jgi:hypothetical protein